jgi:hypothetical protein
MLIERRDNTFDTGVKDVICILKNINTGRYHAAFFEESPMPSQGNTPLNELEFIRLKSKMHHTVGADTIDEALKHVVEMRTKIHVRDENVCLEPKEWNGEIGVVWIMQNTE